jgi:hypothetical protein
MPWPQQIDRLLARADSRAAQALRWGLRGLAASLQAAVHDVPDDPGREEVRELMAAVDTLLGPTGVASDATLPAAEAGESLPCAAELPLGAETPEGAPRLLPLARAVAADPRFREELRLARLREGTDDEVWNDVQRLLLRVAPELAEEWLPRCRSYAEQAGSRPDDARANSLPLGREEVIFPGLTGAAQATGLRSTAAAALDSRMSGLTGEEIRTLAGIVSTYLSFIEKDPDLHHCLQAVYRFGIAPLTGEQRQRYAAELLRRWERVRSAGQAPKERFKAHLDLDEALHSLVYQPPVDARSWWGRLQSQARDGLLQARDRAARAGCQVHLQLLGGSFADVNRLAPDSLQVDFGVPGEVAACLRVWARIDGEELKGRVLYRSPREEP